MGGIDASSTAFLFLLVFAALFGALIFGIAQNGTGSMGRVLIHQAILSATDNPLPTWLSYWGGFHAALLLETLHRFGRRHMSL